MGKFTAWVVDLWGDVTEYTTNGNGEGLFIVSTDGSSHQIRGTGDFWGGRDQADFCRRLRRHLNFGPADGYSRASSTSEYAVYAQRSVRCLAEAQRRHESAYDVSVPVA